MQNLMTTRAERNRGKLVFASTVRFGWILMGALVIAFSELEKKQLLIIILAVHFVINIPVWLAFHRNRFTEIATYTIITADILVITAGVAVTGALFSPLVSAYIMQVGLTVLLSDTRKGYYNATTASLGYIMSGILQLKGILPAIVGLTVPPFIFAMIYFAFVPTALFTVAFSMGYVVSKLEESEQHLFRQGEQLKESLDQVNKLKEQQDGDYFLTSLLIDPLMRHVTESATVRTESLIKQKKEFAFRKFRREIGGDLCLAHNIRLNGGKYTAILNADAMGKSMQGAGGALVLGSIFQNIMERTSQNEPREMPELWLASAFREIHDVFLSFNGSMLVSVFFALIDERTGVIYHLNAEHPEAVLFRDGKADFLSAGEMLSKAGTPDMNKEIRIRIDRLRDGDVLICGSDGRDDIETGSDAAGQRIINHDENIFPRLVAEAAGDLAEIYSMLTSQGLTDDLSLMRMDIGPVEKPVSDAEASALLSGISARGGDRLQALTELYRTHPERKEPLREIISTLRSAGKTTAAYQWALGLHMRSPEDPENNYFLALCHLSLRRSEEAEKLLRKVIADGTGSYVPKAEKKLAEIGAVSRKS